MPLLHSLCRIPLLLSLSPPPPRRGPPPPPSALTGARECAAISVSLLPSGLRSHFQNLLKRPHYILSAVGGGICFVSFLSLSSSLYLSRGRCVQTSHHIPVRQQSYSTAASGTKKTREYLSWAAKQELKHFCLRRHL